MTEPGPSGSSVASGRPMSKQPPPDLGNRLSPTRRSLPPVAIHQENRHRAGWVSRYQFTITRQTCIFVKSVLYLAGQKQIWTSYYNSKLALWNTTFNQRNQMLTQALRSFNTFHICCWETPPPHKSKINICLYIFNCCSLYSLYLGPLTLWCILNPHPFLHQL